MNDKSQTLAQRREMLVECCRLQRQQLAAQRMSLRQSFGVADNLSRVAAFARENRLPLAGIALGLLILRPKRFASLAVSAATLWKTWQKVSPVAVPLLRRFIK